MRAVVFTVLALLSWPALAQGNGDSSAYSILSEQLVVIATIVAAIAALPPLIEFLIDRRKRRERLALSIDDLAVSGLDVRLAGIDDLLGEIADLIDRAKHPQPYEALKVGNEILIIGPPLSGKKSLAMRIAREAGAERVIIVYNARNADALSEAKKLVGAYKNRKIMLLLPRLDKVDDPDDEEVQTELDALIETTSSMHNVLVVGTAVDFAAGGLLDQMFGIVLVLPGAPVTRGEKSDATPEARRMLASVAGYYIDLARDNGVVLSGIEKEAVIARLTEVARNPADIEDIVVLMQTTAVYRARQKQTPSPLITGEIVEKSIRRVIVDTAED